MDDKIKDSDAPTWPETPPRFRGRPILDPEACAQCGACAEACQTGAIRPGEDFSLDMTRCLFCGECAFACQTGAVTLSRDCRTGAATREALLIRPDNLAGMASTASMTSTASMVKEAPPSPSVLRVHRLATGGCGGCDETVARLPGLAAQIYGRETLAFVDDPATADVILLTGPVPDERASEVRAIIDAALAENPAARMAVCGACGLFGGATAPELGGDPQAGSGLSAACPDLPDDLIALLQPGCPPHPLALLHGLLTHASSPTTEPSKLE